MIISDVILLQYFRFKSLGTECLIGTQFFDLAVRLMCLAFKYYTIECFVSRNSNIFVKDIEIILECDEEQDHFLVETFEWA